MSKFQELGNSIRQSGGVFEFELGNDGRITDVFVMKASMKPYCEMFGDFIINDGTHNVDRYGLIMVNNTMVDSVGKSVIACYSQYRSEQSNHITRALQHFGLGQEGTTLMTDDGPAYRLVADALKLLHALCTKQYNNGIFPAQAGLGSLANCFQKDMFKAIYSNFRSGEALEYHLASALKKYSASKSAVKFISELQQNQKLVCRAHTAWIFIAGCISTQRGESSNGRLKIG